MSTHRLLAILSIVVVVASACAGPGAGPGATAGDGPSAPGSPGGSTPGPATPGATEAPDLNDLRVPIDQWATDFRIASVDLGEFIGGGPPKDDIPPIDEPRYESIAAAQAWLDPTAPVIALEVDGAARAYPLAILIWHEIANDTLGGIPVVVTFCPLCHTALVFERTLEGTVHDFGTTGNLRFSDLVMYDRQTESWWQQATGEAIVGTLTGSKLT